MNPFENIPPEIINPPALVQQAFDEERMLAEVKVLIAQRDDGRETSNDAILAIGHKFLAARRALPGIPAAHGERDSEAFRTLIGKVGLSRSTILGYMSYARRPDSLKRKRALARTGGKFSSRTRFLKEIRDALLNATKEEVLDAINLELNNANAQATS